MPFRQHIRVFGEYFCPLNTKVTNKVNCWYFQRLDIRGKIKPLHGQNRKTEEPLALFCICTPFGPPSLLEMPQKEIMFKSKHKHEYWNWLRWVWRFATRHILTVNYRSHTREHFMGSPKETGNCHCVLSVTRIMDLIDITPIVDINF